jgi:hypothetical protein
VFMLFSCFMIFPVWQNFQFFHKYAIGKSNFHPEMENIL